MNKKKMNYLTIILYSIILIIILKGKNHLYGSNIDWINQHTTITELFRNIFYETKRLIPNYLFNIGAGQNIFNYSYYGLMSPIILISYLLPFLDMKKYIELASIVLYIVTGILLYKFLLSKKNSTKLSLLSTISFQTFASITYHFHHHIMFVWYFPFLILALKGVDKYRKEKKSLLLIISIFLIIMTNYYYSVPSIITITIYGTYTLLQENLTGKELKITNIVRKHLDALLTKLTSAGVEMDILENEITIHGHQDLKAINVKTLVYPGFVTDWGQPMSVLLTQCHGTSIFEETIYENRMGHVPYLNKMGANMKVKNQTIEIQGPTPLKGQDVVASDLRAGASLVIAGLISEGSTTIQDAEHILRGYERIVEKLTNVGAKLELIDIN